MEGVQLVIAICDKFVILHCFTKKTQKTPAKEIERAKRNRKDFLKRGGMNDEEN